MPKIMLFYEDTGKRLEFDGPESPIASHYPTYTILYNPYFAHNWYRCHQLSMKKCNEWFTVPVEEVDKQFRVYALLGG